MFTFREVGILGKWVTQSGNTQRELEICDWHMKELFDRVESKETGEPSKRKTIQKEKCGALKTRTRYVENSITLLGHSWSPYYQFLAILALWRTTQHFS